MKGTSLFAHLPQYTAPSPNKLHSGFSIDIHRAILEFGLKQVAGEITGSNARCVAMLEAFKEVCHKTVHVQQKMTI